MTIKDARLRKEYFRAYSRAHRLSKDVVAPSIEIPDSGLTSEHEIHVYPISDIQHQNSERRYLRISDIFGIDVSASCRPTGDTGLDAPVYARISLGNQPRAINRLSLIIKRDIQMRLDRDGDEEFFRPAGRTSYT